MTTSASTPSVAAAQASAWAWLPAETPITPLPRSSAVSDRIRLSAPRALNEPVCWNSSAFRYRPGPRLRDVNVGVRWTAPSIVRGRTAHIVRRDGRVRHQAMVVDRAGDENAAMNRDRPPLPVRVVVTDDLARSRVTVFFRLLLALPHLVVVTLWGIAALAVSVVLWLALVVEGKAPDDAAVVRRLVSPLLGAGERLRPPRCGAVPAIRWCGRGIRSISRSTRRGSSRVVVPPHGSFSRSRPSSWSVHSVEAPGSATSRGSARRAPNRTGPWAPARSASPRRRRCSCGSPHSCSADRLAACATSSSTASATRHRRSRSSCS